MEIRIRPNTKQFDFLMDEKHLYLAMAGRGAAGKAGPCGRNCACTG